MDIQVSAGPILSIVAGVLILAFPKLLSYIVAIYLIVFGVLTLVQMN